MADEPTDAIIIHGWTPKKVTGMVSLVLIVVFAFWYFQDDLAAYFDTRAAISSNTKRSKANEAGLKENVVTARDQIANMTEKLNALESKINAHDEKIKQAKVERDKNTLFTADQPKRGAARTVRLNNHDKDIDLLRDQNTQLLELHLSPGKHPNIEHSHGQ